MRYVSWTALLLLSPALMVASAQGCGSDPASDADANVDIDGNVIDGTSPDATGMDVEIDAPLAEFGLDVRPANPTCKAPAPPPVTAPVKFERVFNNLSFQSAVGLFQAPGDPTRFFVLEQGGRVRVFPNKANPANNEVTTYLDISTSSMIDFQFEKGLLGLAFHPNWAGGNRALYLSYTRASGDLERPFSRIGKWVSTDNGATMNGATEQTVFDKLRQPYGNHNGGWIGFGKDGYLYYSLGDGGQGGDPLNAGQDKNTLLGKILRIDVNGAAPYAIPPTNPFAAGGGLGEIYAYGMRNAWRLSFDRDTGDLWGGDVGQGAWEEIDKVTIGGNYGWRVMEGSRCYNAASCNSAGMIPPVSEHPHTPVGQAAGPDNAKSITGGYVYRGKAIPSFVGTYIYGDFITGNVWALAPDGTGKLTPRFLVNAGVNVASFGEDLDGELYLVGHGGQILKLLPNGNPPADTFPKTLSATGCFAVGDPRKPGPGLIPYEPISQLWSDNAAKSRYMAIPDGTKITLKADGDFDFPNGSVLVKNFEIGGKFVETRLFMRHDDGTWAGYSYEWNDAQTDATLLQAGKVKAVGSQNWIYPSRGECLSCHTAAAGHSLGLELAQLNHEYVYTSTVRKSNQVKTLEKIGLFNGAVPTLPSYLVRPSGMTGTAEQKARSYLHSNCSFCHRPQGGALGTLDLTYTQTLSSSKLCEANKQGDVGLPTAAKIVSPGKPAESVLSVRMKALDVRRMPPLASGIVDPSGTKVVDDWISGLTSCP
ncbi:MAG: PQQ-dependent sugar dehydrogenase [Polyangiaceae bacterium]|nr:PQQ-dependent sugar dehydrogenase [Polyangiaceae bacterium]